MIQQFVVCDFFHDSIGNSRYCVDSKTSGQLRIGKGMSKARLVSPCNIAEFTSNYLGKYISRLQAQNFAATPPFSVSKQADISVVARLLIIRPVRDNKIRTTAQHPITTCVIIISRLKVSILLSMSKIFPKHCTYSSSFMKIYV